MSEIQEIDVYVKPNGTVKVEVRGAKGGKCLELTEELVNLLGGQIVDRIRTDEFHQAEQIEEQQGWTLQKNSV